MTKNAQFIFAVCNLRSVAFSMFAEKFFKGLRVFLFLYVCIYSFIFFGNWACETPIVRGFWFTLLTIEKSSVYVSLFLPFCFKNYGLFTFIDMQ